MATLKIAVIEGDGVGPEVTREAVKVLKAVAELGDHRFTFRSLMGGQAAYAAHGSSIPQQTIDACLDTDAVLFGAVGDNAGPRTGGIATPDDGLLRLRSALGGFANLRPAKFYSALSHNSPLKEEIVAGANVLIVREFLGGLYYSSPRSLDLEKGVAENTMRYSDSEVRRVTHVAFQAARQRRKKVTSVDKANALETSRLWRHVVNQVAREYPDVGLTHAYVDTCAMQLVSSPRSFDVILAENLFGDILSDEAMVLSGSIGMLPSATVGGKVNFYEPIHGSAPDIAGRGIANPLGAIASGALLLRYSAGLEEAAGLLEQAIDAVLEDGYRTPDLSRERVSDERRVSTQEMGNAVCARILKTVCA